MQCVLPRYTHPLGRSGFATPELARRFRAEAFAKHGINATLEPSSVPHTITVLSNVYGEKVRTGLGLRAPLLAPTQSCPGMYDAVRADDHGLYHTADS